MKKKLLQLKGFTLVETIVATGIIMFALIGPLSVAINSSTYAKESRDQVTATYLAQEAVELLRFHRDTLFLQCVNNVTSCPAIDMGSGVYEQSNETAWRL
jgi:Tfp pilus assembly protein PilV